jgi:hypothetical protein
MILPALFLDRRFLSVRVQKKSFSDRQSDLIGRLGIVRLPAWFSTNCMGERSALLPSNWTLNLQVE